MSAQPLGRALTPFSSRLLVLNLLFILTGLCVTRDAQAQGGIYGYVTDQTTKAAIVGAQVTLDGKSTLTTNSNGFYFFNGVVPGAHTITAAASQYTSASESVTFKNRTLTYAATLALIPQSLIINSISGPGSAIPWNGKKWYVSGINYAWQNYGTDFGTGGWGKFTDWAQIGTDFGNMRGQGVRAVRWWVFADGRYSPDFNPDGTISGLDSSVFSDIDQALAIAAKNNIYLIPTLVDFMMWTAPISSGSVTGGGHSAMISDAKTQQSYLDNALKPLLQHVAASANKNFVLAYDIVNEPEWTIGGLGGGSSSTTVAQVQTFVQKCASYIHQYGGGAYATLGAATPSWVGNWKGLGLDFYQVHYYPNYDWNGPGSGLPAYASLNLDRPCIVGEFATSDQSYGIGDTGVQSAQWYLDTIAKYGYAGALGWGYQKMDDESNWAAFQPVYTNWAAKYSSTIGPQ